MKDSRKLCDYAQARIDGLRKEGVKLSDENVCVINALAWEVMTPSKRVSLSRGKPVKCGDFWLWPLTISNWKWMNEIGFHLPCAEFALAFVMVNRTRDAWTIQESEIAEWSKHLTVTIGELRMAMSIIINQTKRDEEPLSKDEGISIEELAIFMHSAHGGSVQMWEHDLSIDYILDYADTVLKQSQADGQKVAKNRAEACLALYCHKLRKAARNG